MVQKLYTSFIFLFCEDSQPSGNSSRSHTIILAFASSTACVCLLILGFGVLWWRYRHNQQIFFDINGSSKKKKKKKTIHFRYYQFFLADSKCFSEQHPEEMCLGNLKRFQFRELQSATNNFSGKNLIGKGGFGYVYKGCLRDGSVVAVKRLKDGNAIGGEIQFQTEVEMISLAVHRNLLRLYGFCMTASERLLVYPYMSNGSVASRLKGLTFEISIKRRL